VVQKPPPHPHPHPPPQPFIPREDDQRGFFSGAKPLITLGIISSLLALSISLWSLHKNSDVVRRINSLNSSVADLIVAARTAPVVETGRERVNEPRYKRQQYVKPPKVETSVSRMLVDVERENTENELERKKVLDRMKRETSENLLKMERAGKEAIQEGTSYTLSMQALPPKLNNVKLEKPDMSGGSTVPGIAKMMDHISMATEKLGQKITPKRLVDDVDMTDLDRDLRLLTSGR